MPRRQLHEADGVDAPRANTCRCSCRRCAHADGLLSGETCKGNTHECHCHADVGCRGLSRRGRCGLTRGRIFLGRGLSQVGESTYVLGCRWGVCIGARKYVAGTALDW